MNEIIEVKDYPVGMHLFKTYTLYRTISSYVKECGIRPCQMFLHTAKGSIPTPLDLEQTSELISSKNIPYFTHSSLGINLCKSKTHDLTLLQADLLGTSKVNGRGVVVHVGRACSTDVGRACSTDVGILHEQSVPNGKGTEYDVMISNIRKVIQYATPECPLLIETPAGQKNELCSRFSEFSQLFTEFKSDPCLKICVDTCHIFAAGYAPLDYLKTWDKHHGAHTIGLVHLNDSKFPCGACKDRHQYIGKGYIGMKAMVEVIEWCKEKKISMVFESPSKGRDPSSYVTI